MAADERLTFCKSVWGCLGVTAPDPELAAQLAAGPLSLNMPVRRLMKNPQASALLQAVLGGYVAGHCV